MVKKSEAAIGTIRKLHEIQTKFAFEVGIGNLVDLQTCPLLVEGNLIPERKSASVSERARKRERANKVGKS
jgi:hypothetical protein